MKARRVFQIGSPIAAVRGTQSLYFDDPTFLARSRIPPPPTGRSTAALSPNGNRLTELEPFEL
jgi:hypothetical protein